MEAKQLNLSDADIRQIVDDHLLSSGSNVIPSYRVVRALLEPFSPCPEGFLADHYALKVTIETNGQTEEYNFFAKCLPTDNPVLSSYLEEMGSFHKESSVLQRMVGAIQRLCPWRTVAPRVIFAKGEKILIMNNLKSAGYAIVKRQSGLLEVPFIQQALETLACLHGGSIVLEEQQGKRLPELFPNVLKENGWVQTPTSTRVKDVANVIKLYTELVKICDHWQGARKQTILEHIAPLIRRIYSYVEPSHEFRNCLNHGDLWCNNIMFKCNEQGQPTGCALVDYQLSRYVPPAYDINLLLYLTTSRQQREANLPSLLDHYYKCFSEMLERNQLQVGDIYPREAFLRCCERYRLAGLIHSTIISGEVTLPNRFLEEIFGDLQTTASFMPDKKVWVCVKAFQADELYRKHLIELMDELFECVKE
uniref:CHK kinase-like domain-containing protein n=1 Tax=Anopheles culicifacies TaxID=139723 RepID=A0A182LS85_9DIPT